LRRVVNLNRGHADCKEATQWYQSFSILNWAGFYSARSTLAWGEMAEAAGDAEQALRWYGLAEKL